MCDQLGAKALLEAQAPEWDVLRGGRAAAEGEEGGGQLVIEAFLEARLKVPHTPALVTTALRRHAAAPPRRHAVLRRRWRGARRSTTTRTRR